MHLFFFFFCVLQTFSSFTIGAPAILDQDSSNKQESNSVHSLPRKKRYRLPGKKWLKGFTENNVGFDSCFHSDVRSPGLSSHIPNYFSLPIALSSLKSAANEQHTGTYIYMTLVVNVISKRRLIILWRGGKSRSWSPCYSPGKPRFHLGQVYVFAWPDWTLCRTAGFPEPAKCSNFPRSW